jgi:hypothetical protein
MKGECNMLYVIAGHGAGDPGACGNGYQEAERVRALAQRIKDIGGDKVTLCDFNINAYKSNVIGKKLVPKGSKILELHMDSANPSARGGHVIIKKGFKADDYDKALAALISDMFPGRDKSIVERSDLANVNRAATCGYNYRLLECGFISNAEDVKIFNSRMDELAKGILTCFGIKEAPKPTVVPQPTQAPVAQTKSLEDWANEVKAGKHGTGHANREASLKKAGCTYAYADVRAKVNELCGVKTSTQPTTNYYPKYTGVSYGIDTVFEAIGVPASMRGSWKNRKPIAQANGISNYKGTGAQNSKLITLAKQGKLKKS